MFIFVEMQLENLQNHLELCIVKCMALGRLTRALQLTEQLEVVKNKSLASPDDKKINGIYLGQSK